jgi:energy-coupling factor transport system ATP-binding protein
VPAGACLLVVGPSGSGKSTLGLALAGLVPRELPGAWLGSLIVDGVETRAFGPGALASRAGLVFQDPSRQIVMERGEDDVAFGLETRAWPRAAMRERVPVVLEAVGLGGSGRHLARSLSGGQQQRLALAGVLAPMPGLLILDEPTADLDPDGAAAFFERLASIRADRSATIVLVEHRVAEAWPLADIVLALDGTGRPIAVGPPDRVLAEHGRRLSEAGIWLPSGRPGRASPPHRAAPAPPPAASEEPLLRASGVTFGYHRATPVVVDVSLEAEPGDRIALVGPNGGGKSTVGRLLVGLLTPDQGSVRLGGADPARLPADVLARWGGYVFQEPERQFLTQTVRDEVLLGLVPDEVARVDGLMERLGLPLGTFGARSPYRLSGGEQRRLSLAAVLVRRPRVLVLDEPTFGQDRHGYEGLLAILHERLEAGTCLIVSTHDDRLVADLATRVIRLDHGRVVSDESVS